MATTRKPQTLASEESLAVEFTAALKQGEIERLSGLLSVRGKQST